MMRVLVIVYFSTVLFFGCAEKDCCDTPVEFYSKFSIIDKHGRILLGNDSTYVLMPKDIKFRYFDPPIDIPVSTFLAEDSSTVYVSPQLITFDTNQLLFYVQYGHYVNPIFPSDTMEWRVSTDGNHLVINGVEQRFEEIIQVIK